VFRRRREDTYETGAETEPSDASPQTELPPGTGPRGSGPETPGGGGHGPWDVLDEMPPGERIDFGSLRVPVVSGVEIQVSMTENQVPAWITVVHGESSMVLQAFAAPKSGGLWEDVREEIAEQVRKDGGQAEQARGPFGVELRARISSPDPARPGKGTTLQPARFLGVDGPRWFVRGLISGPAARRPEQARALERVFGDVVVVRGDHAVPPRDPLEISLPKEAREALGQETGEPEPERWQLNMFERGPEITETR
jgi:Protein of unknown function (DUF3710)